MEIEELLMPKERRLMRHSCVLKTNGPSFIANIRHAPMEFIKSNGFVII